MKLSWASGIQESGYDNTPHNVGFAVADALREKLAVNWEAWDGALVAFGKLGDSPVLLVKPQNYVNNVGQVLKKLSTSLNFTPGDCILLQDDIHLPLGKLRSRTRGSDGGHKGVSSVLVAFQTDEFRRVKIGVAPAVRPNAWADYLVTPFSPEAAADLAPAIIAAMDRVLAMLGQSRGKRQALDTHEGAISQGSDL